MRLLILGRDGFRAVDDKWTREAKSAREISSSGTICGRLWALTRRRHRSGETRGLLKTPRLDE